MSIKEYVDQMIIEPLLSNQDKINLLKVWIEKTQQKIFSSPLHRSELIVLHDGIEYMEEKIVELEKLISTNKTIVPCNAHLNG